MPSQQIQYSDKYYDNKYEYRHVILPRDIARIKPDRLLTEAEWRGLGVQQSRGWVHYAIHRPEPHILLFRREITTAPPPDQVAAAQQATDMNQNAPKNDVGASEAQNAQHQHTEQNAQDTATATGGDVPQQ